MIAKLANVYGSYAFCGYQLAIQRQNRFWYCILNQSKLFHTLVLPGDACEV